MPTNPGPTNLVEWLSLDEVSGTRTGSHAARALADVNTVGSTAVALVAAWAAMRLLRALP